MGSSFLIPAIFSFIHITKLRGFWLFVTEVLCIHSPSKVDLKHRLES